MPGSYYAENALSLELLLEIRVDSRILIFIAYEWFHILITRRYSYIRLFILSKQEYRRRNFMNESSRRRTQRYCSNDKRNNQTADNDSLITSGVFFNETISFG